MKIIIRGELCEPPSEVYSFRDITLYASCFLHADVLLETRSEERDSYYKWLKHNGAYDFVSQIIKRNEEAGFKIGPTKSNLIVDRLTPNNLNFVVGTLRRLLL